MTTIPQVPASRPSQMDVATPKSPESQENLDPQPILQRYIRDELLNGRMTVEVDDDLLSDEIIDSLGMMRLIAFIEETFNVTVPLEDITIQHFRTIETIHAYVQRRESHGAGQ